MKRIRLPLLYVALLSGWATYGLAGPSSGGGVNGSPTFRPLDETEMMLCFGRNPTNTCQLTIGCQDNTPCPLPPNGAKVGDSCGQSKVAAFPQVCQAYSNEYPNLSACTPAETTCGLCNSTFNCTVQAGTPLTCAQDDDPTSTFCVYGNLGVDQCTATGCPDPQTCQP
jgi:hypothetical protein